MLRILVDGACRGNPGPMGWAAIFLRDGELLKEVSLGSSDRGTNNIAEMQAVLLGIVTASSLTEPEESVTIVSDSTMSIGLLSQNWHSRTPHLIRLRYHIRRAEAKLGASVTYEKGGVDDELFQLVDVLAKEAVPVSSVACCSMCSVVAPGMYWSNTPFPEGWDKNGEGGQWRCDLCVDASAVPEGHKEKAAAPEG